ncbi:MAG: hypothetical protein KGO05_14395 [Chloroflexota bacterium]|nr:hypothetical protein [Chloroflexota bacterium]
MAKRERSGSGFFLGLMIGIAVGATIVWVLTPQPGEIERARAKAGGAPDPTDAARTTAANGATAPDATDASRPSEAAQPTILDLAMAAVERVRGRLGDAMALGREAYTQGQAEVMQRFNQARTME